MHLQGTENIDYEQIPQSIHEKITLREERYSVNDKQNIYDLIQIYHGLI